MDKLGPFVLGPGGPVCGLYNMDAKDLAADIPANSVDLIFTDPVYDRIGDYAWLGHVAGRILVPGGQVVAQVGTIHRYAAERAMREGGLVPLPLLAEIFNPMQSTPLRGARVHSNLRPFLWFSKGKRAGEWLNAATYGAGRDKRFHEWGDSTGFIADKVRRLAPEGGIVVDFFAGGGTVGAVCKMLGRRFLGSEIDGDTCPAAVQRIRLAPAPLPVLAQAQLGLVGS